MDSTSVHIFKVFGRYYMYDGTSSIIYLLSNEMCEGLLSGGSAYEELLKYSLLINRQKYNSEAEKKEQLCSYSLSGITLYLTSSCNMRCTYCYEQKNDATQRIPDMDFDRAIEIITWALNYSNPNVPFTITFFGGEPFLKFPLIKRIVAHMRKNCQQKVIYSITSNGTIMNEDIIAFLKNEPVSLCISVDGPKDIQDLNRPLKSGCSSYDLVSKNLRILSKADIPYSVSSVLHHGNTDLESFQNNLSQMGVPVNCIVPVSSTDELTKLSACDVNDILSHSEKIAAGLVEQLQIGSTCTIPDFIGWAIRLYPQMQYRFYCGAATQGIAIDSLYNIAPCHRFIGSSEVTAFGKLPTKVDFIQYQATFGRAENYLECADCWAYPICRRWKIN